MNETCNEHGCFWVWKTHGAPVEAWDLVRSCKPYFAAGCVTKEIEAEVDEFLKMLGMVEAA